MTTYREQSKPAAGRGKRGPQCGKPVFRCKAKIELKSKESVSQSARSIGPKVEDAGARVLVKAGVGWEMRRRSISKNTKGGSARFTAFKTAGATLPLVLSYRDFFFCWNF